MQECPGKALAEQINRHSGCSCNRSATKQKKNRGGPRPQCLQKPEEPRTGGKIGRAAETTQVIRTPLSQELHTEMGVLMLRRGHKSAAAGRLAQRLETGIHGRSASSRPATAMAETYERPRGEASGRPSIGARRGR